MARSLKRKARQWVPVAGSEEGGNLVAFRMRPATYLEHEMAVERASTAARQLQEAEEVRIAYGLEEFEISEVVDEGEVLLGFSKSLLATELALIVADDFKGYLGEDGEPAAFSRRNVALAMQDWQGGVSIAHLFLNLALAPVYLEAVEEKP